MRPGNGSKAQHCTHVDLEHCAPLTGAPTARHTPRERPCSARGVTFSREWQPRGKNMAEASGSALAHLQYYDNRMKECQLTEDESRALDHFRCVRNACESASIGECGSPRSCALGSVVKLASHLVVWWVLSALHRAACLPASPQPPLTTPVPSLVSSLNEGSAGVVCI